MANLTYNPHVFRVADEDAAKAIILTPDGGQSTEERWARETPYLAELLGDRLGIGPGALVVDFGCGLGRMAKALIERSGCQVLGVDLSLDMRAMAPRYVNSGHFSAVSGEMFSALVAKGLQADAAITVWVLQHCLSPHLEIDRLRNALRPGGRLGVVNTHGRVVPTVEKTWASDGVDVRKLLNEKLSAVEDGVLDPAVVGDHISAVSYWGVYAKA